MFDTWGEYNQRQNRRRKKRNELLQIRNAQRVAMRKTNPVVYWLWTLIFYSVWVIGALIGLAWIVFIFLLIIYVLTSG